MNGSEWIVTSGATSWPWFIWRIHRQLLLKIQGYSKSGGVALHFGRVLLYCVNAWRC